ncbi:T6SS phospholipase effector Tle1-like catalytic domain-containing protein [Pseudomonadota bacterium]
MAIYAFDGTMNEDKQADNEDTNVIKFKDAYINAYGSDKCFYVSGVGTRYSVFGAVAGSVGGAGGQARIDEAFDALQDNFHKGDEVIDIIGFSRGSALALEFANQINERKVAGQKSPSIRFVGLWDTVASFGLPGNNINLSYTLTLPRNVKRCYHALSLDERRLTFPLTRVDADAYSTTNDEDDQIVREVWFRGFHSDVGGGNKNDELSSIPLVWMFHMAKMSGIEISQEDIGRYTALCNAEAKCKKPGMDLIPNKKRTIHRSDLVHETVTRREDITRWFEANNPPKGLQIVNDSDTVLQNKFQ